MKYYLVKKVNNEYKIIDIMHNRKELLKTIKEYQWPMYYCTNGSYNYNNATLIEIFNQTENKLIKEKSQVFITKENKFTYHYGIDNDILEV